MFEVIDINYHEELPFCSGLQIEHALSHFSFISENVNKNFIYFHKKEFSGKKFLTGDCITSIVGKSAFIFFESYRSVPCNINDFIFFFQTSFFCCIFNFVVEKRSLTGVKHSLK